METQEKTNNRTRNATYARRNVELDPKTAGEVSTTSERLGCRMRPRILDSCFLISLVIAVSQSGCQRMPPRTADCLDSNGPAATDATSCPREDLDGTTDLQQFVSPDYMPTPSGTATLPANPTPYTCVESSVRLERTSYLGWFAPGQVPVLVYLPPCYDDQDRSYPVLYLLHGKPQDENHWLILDIEDALENAYREGALPPFLVVMPRQPEPLFSSTDGGPGSYEAEFIKGLVPFIDRTYRTIIHENSRGLAGISRGGVWALEIGFRNADTIQRVGALSPALNVNYARPEFDPFNLLHGDLPSKIFLMSGDGDSAYGKTLELSEALREAGIEHEYILESGVHDSNTWRGILPELLRYLTDGW